MIFYIWIVDIEFKVTSVAFLLCADNYLATAIDGTLCNIG